MLQEAQHCNQAMRHSCHRYMQRAWHCQPEAAAAAAAAAVAAAAAAENDDDVSNDSAHTLTN
jgi:hypothetical protein